MIQRTIAGEVVVTAFVGIVVIGVDDVFSAVSVYKARIALIHIAPHLSYLVLALALILIGAVDDVMALLLSLSDIVI